jgi:hypothetical protein
VTSSFDVPIVLFLYKRSDTALRVLRRIADAAPRRLYLIADGPRSDEDSEQVAQCRAAVDEFVAGLECEVVRNYAASNRGVYANIGEGAKWVFEREETAIFLEDDTIPDPSFFGYCRELLERYRLDDRILWVCGTNYLREYEPADGADYVFTQHMLPCGWASWASKFPQYYDGRLELFTPDNVRRIRRLYRSDRLYRYDVDRIGKEHSRGVAGERFLSWDYQMAFSLRVHDKYGTVPRYNLIENVGADADSTHGGDSAFHTMTRRFCNIPTRPVPSPLKHPAVGAIDQKFERRTDTIVTPPDSRLRRFAVNAFKAAFDVPEGMSTREAIYRLRAGELDWKAALRPFRRSGPAR